MHNDTRVQRYLNHNNINQTEATYGDSLLHCAIRSGNEEMVTILLNANIDTTIVNKDGKTALQTGSQNKAVKILINHEIEESKREVSVLTRNVQESEKKYSNLKRDYECLTDAHQRYCEDSQAREQKLRENVSDNTRLKKRIKQLETINKNLLKTTKK